MLTLKAPAKINWFLKVFGLRDDGYHDIKSLIQKISLYDVLTFVSSGELILKTDLNVPVEQNLVYKAAVLLREKFRLKNGVEIHLKKNIPVAAGLGGGSSDAAVTLRALNELWSLRLSNNDLGILAEQIGSDVPFFLHNNLAYVEGKGDRITSLKAGNPVHILLVKPSVSVSTRWVYENFTSDMTLSQTSRDISYDKCDKKLESELTKKNDTLDNIRYFIRTLGRTEPHENINISNDLETVTIQSFPVISDIKQKLLKEGALVSLMSGSGPTVFGVFNSADETYNASKAFGDYWTAVAQTLTD
ncbi:MAG: 4-(cytidine 5'-diphospho)-2-C-methyl-D-erythritol kinase [Thermodesulfovibrionia bacterium]|nr:4-(cytidine 5'-diphospho)-2-C-methyl-D-erythritol kinase [Thermodesulfovibrionia bacterium]